VPRFKGRRALPGVERGAGEYVYIYRYICTYIYICIYMYVFIRVYVDIDICVYR